MKTYIKPNTIITVIKLDSQLMTISGGEEQLQGTSNGEYTESGGITLGARQSVWDDEYDDE